MIKIGVAKKLIIILLSIMVTLLASFSCVYIINKHIIKKTEASTYFPSNGSLINRYGIYGSGTEDEPYILEDQNTFTKYMNWRPDLDGDTYRNSKGYAKLSQDITIDITNASFCAADVGVFCPGFSLNGDYHTLNINFYVSDTSSNTAVGLLAGMVESCEIKNLRVVGKLIVDGGAFAVGGLIGNHTGEVTIENCFVDVDIEYKIDNIKNNSIYGIGGIVGTAGYDTAGYTKSLTIKNSCFVGSISASNYNSTNVKVGAYYGVNRASGMDVSTPNDYYYYDSNLGSIQNTNKSDTYASLPQGFHNAYYAYTQNFDKSTFVNGVWDEEYSEYPIYRHPPQLGFLLNNGLEDEVITTNVVTDPENVGSISGGVAFYSQKSVKRTWNKGDSYCYLQLESFGLTEEKKVSITNIPSDYELNNVSLRRIKSLEYNLIFGMYASSVLEFGNLVGSYNGQQKVYEPKFISITVVARDILMINESTNEDGTFNLYYYLYGEQKELLYENIDSAFEVEEYGTFDYVWQGTTYPIHLKKGDNIIGGYADLATTYFCKTSLKLKNYNIVYSIEGTNHKDNPDTYTIEQEVKLKDPTRQNHTFLGWYSDDAYTKKVESPHIPKGSKGDKTFYAKWEKTRYDIEYELNGGNLPSGVTNPSWYTIESETITLNNPIRANYEFIGWTGGSDNDCITDPTIDVTILKGSTGNRTYTANWVAVKYKIYYENIEGYGKLPNGVTNPTFYTIEQSIDLPIPECTKLGYEFIGWTGTELSNNPAENLKVKIPKGSTGDRVYTANWGVVTYTITWNLNDGAWTAGTIPITTYNINDLANGELLLDFQPEKVKYGFTYEFLGWLDDDTDVTAKIQRITVDTLGDKIYYASWDDLKIPVRFHSSYYEDGLEIKPAKADEETGIYTYYWDPLYNHNIPTSKKPINFIFRKDLQTIELQLGYDSDYIPAETIYDLSYEGSGSELTEEQWNLMKTKYKDTPLFELRIQTAIREYVFNYDLTNKNQDERLLFWTYFDVGESLGVYTVAARGIDVYVNYELLRYHIKYE